MNSQSQWYIHLRADSSPQGGRDYFICEYDHVRIGSALGTGKQHLSGLLESGNMTLTTRILPLSIIGSRAASATHKGRQLLRALALDSDSLQASIARCMSLMFDFGAESGRSSQKFSNRTRNQNRYRHKNIKYIFSQFSTVLACADSGDAGRIVDFG